jgi:hypothetical protein
LWQFAKEFKAQKEIAINWSVDLDGSFFREHRGFFPSSSFKFPSKSIQVLLSLTSSIFGRRRFDGGMCYDGILLFFDSMTNCWRGERLR